ncbi:MAG: hypothetical protein HY320_15880 [Armatimonadetes bacterium]|nr:hypothetical protein [Armatimonadota bacterium]
MDFYHASEHLWNIANLRFGTETPEAKAWVAARQAELKNNQVAHVWAAIAAWRPRSAEKRQARRSELHYFATHAERMRYGTYLVKGYHIASGGVEAACKHVVGSRLDQAGMHWRCKTAEAVVALRAAICSTDPPDLRPYCRMAA